jgi:hypothetical protein
MQALNSLLSLGSLLLLLFSLGALLWFAYWFFLRRYLRLRRIANARMARLTRERVLERKDGDSRD